MPATEPRPLLTVEVDDEGNENFVGIGHLCGTCRKCYLRPEHGPAADLLATRYLATECCA